MSATAVVTIVSGRHTHLRRQRQWLARLDPAPLTHIVVAMGDPEVLRVANEQPDLPTHVVELSAQAELPLAAARNRGVAAAAGAGASEVVLLDVDCLPDASLVGDYSRALEEVSDPAYPQVVTGRVRYLPEGLADDDHTPTQLEAVGRDHPARVVPEGDELVEGDPNLLWSLNFAVTVDDWRRIGGFDERYVGYGGEDTDFGQRLAAVGGSMWWTSRAGVFHQYHPSTSPPVAHAAAIARNANLFRSIWGFDPMEGWIEELRALGHLAWRDAGWVAIPEPLNTREDL